LLRVFSGRAGCVFANRDIPPLRRAGGGCAKAFVIAARSTANLKTRFNAEILMLWLKAMPMGLR